MAYEAKIADIETECVPCSQSNWRCSEKQGLIYKHKMKYMIIFLNISYKDYIWKKFNLQ